MTHHPTEIDIRWPKVSGDRVADGFSDATHFHPGESALSCVSGARIDRLIGGSSKTQRLVTAWLVWSTACLTERVIVQGRVEFADLARQRIT